MKEVKVLYPAQLSILTDSYDKYGLKEFQYNDQNVDEKDFDINLARAKSFISTPSTLYFRNKVGQLGGVTRNRPKPGPQGLLPQDFSIPYEFMYQVDSSTTKDYIGQSSPLVKNFVQFKLFIDAVELDTTEHRNYRLFSYNGDLFCLLETNGLVGQRRMTYAVLLKFDEDTKQFDSVYKFTEAPIDVRNTLAESEIGSVDYLITDEELFIVYRSVDRSAKTNIVNIFKCHNETDYDDFSFYNSFEIRPKADFYTFNQFRMRACWGGGAITVVTYSINEYERMIDSLSYGDIELKDMRSYTSFDRGITFKTFNDTVSNLYINDANSLVAKFGGSSLASMFIPSFDINATEYDYVEFTVNFDLYYDNDMASFVVLKGGDPPLNATKRAHLMGIKTREDNPLLWEPCLKYFIGVDVEDEVNTTQENANDDFETSTNIYNKPCFYKINDINIIPYGSYNYLYLEIDREIDSDNSSFSQIGLMLMQFQFVANDRKPNGFYDQILAYGSQDHRDFFFVSSIADADATGLIHAGSWCVDGSNKGQNPISCLWRNQLVLSGSQSAIGDEIKFMAISNLWTNLGEDYNYESAYCRFMGGLYNYSDWQHASTGLGSTSFNSVDQVNNFVGTGAASYLRFGYISTSPIGSLLNKATTSNLNSLKIKFQVRFNTLDANRICFYECILKNSERNSGYSLRLYIDSSGLVTATNYDGTLNYGSLGTVNVNTNLEFYVSIGYVLDRQRGFSVWYREHADLWLDYNLLWTPLAIQERAFESGLPDSALNIGIVDYSVSGTYDLDIGDIHVGNYGLGYKPIFESKEVIIDIEPSNNYRTSLSNVEDPYNTRYSKQFSTELELRDGDLIILNGGKLDNRNVMQYDLTKGRTLSRPENLINNICQSTWNMLPFYGYGFQDVEVFFELDHKEEVTHLALLNSVGLVEFDILRGVYETSSDSWVSSVSETFSMLGDSLTIVDTDDKFIEVSNSYPKGSLIDKIVVEYNSSSEYIKQYIIKSNYDSVIEFDETFIENPGSTFYILKTEAYFELSTTLQDDFSQHIGLVFRSTSSAKMMQLGEVVLGQLFDFGEVTVEESVEISSSEDSVESEYGFNFSSNPSQLYTHKIIEYGSIYIEPRSPNENYYQNLINSCYKNNRAICLLHLGEVSGEDVLFGYITDASVDIDGFTKNLSFVVNAQMYKGRI